MDNIEYQQVPIPEHRPCCSPTPKKEFGNPVFAIFAILVGIVFLCFLSIVLAIIYWCSTYSPYVKCDFFPFFTGNGVDTTTWATTSIIITAVSVIVNIIIVCQRFSQTVQIKVIVSIVQLAIFACVICASFCANKGPDGPGTGILVAINVGCAVQFIVVFMAYFEFAYYCGVCEAMCRGCRGFRRCLRCRSKKAVDVLKENIDNNI